MPKAGPFENAHPGTAPAQEPDLDQFNEPQQQAEQNEIPEGSQNGEDDLVLNPVEEAHDQDNIDAEGALDESSAEHSEEDIEPIDIPNRYYRRGWLEGLRRMQMSEPHPIGNPPPWISRADANLDILWAPPFRDGNSGFYHDQGYRDGIKAALTTYDGQQADDPVPPRLQPYQERRYDDPVPPPLRPHQERRYDEPVPPLLQPYQERRYEPLQLPPAQDIHPAPGDWHDDHHGRQNVCAVLAGIVTSYCIIS